MTDPIVPTGETPAAPAQSAAASEPPTQALPAEPPVEEWDKDRAAATIKAQREETKALKAQLKELDQLKAEQKQRVEAEMTEAQKLQAQADKLTAENAVLKADLLRREVVAETGLPSSLADRLKGATKEELLADAKQLLEILPQQKPGPPGINATNPANGQLNENDAQKRERLFGRQGNPFDLETVKQQGGGVIWQK